MTGGDVGVLQVTIAQIYAPEDVVSELGPLYRPRWGAYLVSLFSFSLRAGLELLLFHLLPIPCHSPRGDPSMSIASRH